MAREAKGESFVNPKKLIIAIITIHACTIHFAQTYSKIANNLLVWLK